MFQRRGSHSSVFVASSPSLRSRTPPHLPQAQGAGSTTRSMGRSCARRADRALDGRFARPTRRASPLLLGRGGRRDPRFGFFLALRLFEILDRQFKLFDRELAAFGRLAERLAPRLRKQERQSFDFQRAKLRFALRHNPGRLFLFQQLALREDHRMGAGEVVGKIFEAGFHKAK